MRIEDLTVGVGHNESSVLQSSRAPATIGAATRSQLSSSINRRSGLSSPLPRWLELGQQIQGEPSDLVVQSVGLDGSEPTLALPYLETAFRNPTTWDEPRAFEENVFGTDSAATMEEPLPCLTSDPAFQPHLLSLYFEYVQPRLPMFRRPQFEHDLAAGRVFVGLLNAMLAISFRYLSRQDLSRFLVDKTPTSSDYADRARAQLDAVLSQRGATSLDIVRTACLLAVFDYFSCPNPRSWMSVSTAIRLAIMTKLHQTDSPGVATGLSDASKEDCRYLWWTIWKLDTTISSISMTSFAIDGACIGVAVPTSNVEDYTNDMVQPSALYFLETESSKCWRAFQDMQSKSLDHAFNMHLAAVLFLRGVSQCQQRLQTRPSPGLVGEMMSMKNAFSCIRLALPSEFWNGSKSIDEDDYSHRNRLETLIMLYTGHLIINEPPYEQNVENLCISQDEFIASWQNSILHAEELAGVLRHWVPEYFARADPGICSALWHAACALSLYKMAGTNKHDPFLAARVESSLDLLCVSLEKFAKTWGIGRTLQDSLKTLQSWAWLPLETSRLPKVILEFRKAINPLAQSPGSVDVSLLCAASVPSTESNLEE
ncbi:hypothetical protein PV11_09900 [Exophiala sideris]|uniref:Xylanolytic transcriptional activator regulatory domain-containing protein n=1 Tax=Exophiala sideris TaxID=1016849 RepID=A0A0D1YBH2_9EURO|nr:hypothetical protein PV11_09900 [Exophiala sideris]